MIVSLNEIESTVLKVARGAGYAWGLAEEAGAAARWLAANGLPWLETVGAVFDPITVSLVGPEPEANPLAAAAFLADLNLETMNPERPAPLVPAPPWFAGVLAANVADHTTRLSISWPGTRMVIEHRRLVEATGDLARLAPVPVQVRLSPAQSAAPAGRAASPSTTVEPTRWEALLALEKRTYVPATVESRIAGAGAGLSDND